jgi:TonB family protein
MNLRATLGLWLAMVLSTDAGVAAGADTSGGRLTARVEPPKIDQRHKPDFDTYFPKRVERGALVFIRVKITAKGRVEEPSVADGGFHDEQFTTAALKMAAELRFVPARLNGEPVDYYGIIPIHFEYLSGSTRAVSVSFREEAGKVEKLLEQKDFAGAHFHAQWMLSEKVQNNYEYAILQTTMADTFARTGNIHRALSVSREITRLATLHLDEYQPGGPLPTVTIKDFALWRAPFELEHALRLRFLLATSQGFLLDAARAHADLQALHFAGPDDPTMVKFHEILQQMKDAPQLKAHVRIDDASRWEHDLLYNSFSLRELRGGGIGKIVVSCAGYTHTLEYTPGTDWHVPDRLEECHASIEGKSGTEFDIVEYRDTPAGVAAVAD